MLLASRKQIIKNQRKTVKSAIAINVCGRKSSCELLPLATTHTKVANSGKLVIARYRIHSFFKKSGATAIAPGKLARCSTSLLLSSVTTVSL